MRSPAEGRVQRLASRVMDFSSRWGWPGWVTMVGLGLGLISLGIYLQYASYGTVPSIDGKTQGLVKYSGRIVSVEETTSTGLILLRLDSDRSVHVETAIPNPRLQLEPKPTRLDFAVGDEVTAWEGSDVPVLEAVTVKSALTGATREFATPEFRDAAEAAKAQAAAVPGLSLLAIAGGLGLLLLAQLAVFRSIRTRRGMGAALATVGAIFCLAPAVTVYTFFVVVAARGQSSLPGSIYPIVSTTAALLWVGGVVLAVTGFSVSRRALTTEGRTGGTAGIVAAIGLSAIWLSAIALWLLASIVFSGVQ